jgi:hypothetical protein
MDSILRTFLLHLTKILRSPRTPPSKPSVTFRVTSEKRDRKPMMFLVRTAFWLTLVLVLLPSGRSEPVGGPQVGTAEAVSAASATVSDLGQFCTRQPDACSVGSHALTAVGHRAMGGARMVYEFVTERMGRSNTDPSGTATPTAVRSVSVQSSTDTLSPADLTLPWRDPVARRELRASN